MTTTTGNAAAVLDQLEEWLQTEWPELRVLADVGHGAVGDGRGRRARARASCSAALARTSTLGRGFPFMTLRDGDGRRHPGPRLPHLASPASSPTR